MTGGGAFFDQFIEDYFTESEEHLASARRVLLALEEGRTAGPPDPVSLRELFRSLHTLKGLSGMVGNAAAERVAHALEDALRSAESAAMPFDAPFLDALFGMAGVLERCITARRTGERPPDIDAGLAALERVMPGGSSAPAPPGPTEALPSSSSTSSTTSAVAQQPVASATDGDARPPQHFEFTPSIALSERGITVDVVRTRLRSIGTLLDARPRIVEGGVTFDFSVAVHPGKAPDESWAADGLRWESTPLAVTPMPVTPVFVTPPDPDASAAPPSGAPGSSMVRVDLARLNGVMRLVGELVLSRSRLDELLAQASATDPGTLRDGLEETNAAMERQLRRLRESVMRIRLVPVGEVFERLRFAARDAIRESGRQVRLVFHGQSTEVDKLVVDRMMEPLLHLVRNAVSHGIESPDERVARGKPAEGTLTLRASAAGDRILIEVGDDGAGIDVERVAELGFQRGLLAPDASLSDGELLDLLCAPGFSTRSEVDRTSGRGVGMDVVRSTVRALAGELSLTSVRGAGTRFSIELPLTLMILDALLVQIGDQQMAVPQPSLREILQIETSSIIAFENNDVITYRGSMLPLVTLTHVFDIPASSSPSRYVLVVGTDTAPMGLLVDRVLGLREIVVHPVVDPLVAMPGIAGATELGDGRVSLILDTAAILRLAQMQRETGGSPAMAVARARARMLQAAQARPQSDQSSVRRVAAPAHRALTSGNSGTTG